MNLHSKNVLLTTLAAVYTTRGMPLLTKFQFTVYTENYVAYLTFLHVKA